MQSSTPKSYDQALALAIEAARRAGALLREEFHRPGGPRGAHNHADADDEAGRLICDLLRPVGWGLRCEDPRIIEPGSDGRHVWVIDPNDGTSAFLKGWRGSAVSIAALCDGVPVLGVVYAFCHPDSGAGDLFAWAEGCPLTRNGKEVPTSRLAEATLAAPAGLPAVVFVSQDADRNPAGNTACVAPARYVAVPSIAYRLALVAAGAGLAGVSLNGPQDWDYAAGHALLRGAGGLLVDEQGREVRYGLDGSSQVADCFGGAPGVVGELCLRDWRSVFAAPTSTAGPFPLVRPMRGRAVADAAMLSRAQGCLLGQFAGDSLGGLVEFSSGVAIQANYPNGLRDLRDGGQWSTLAGQPTDDSELALMLARTLLRDGRHDPQEVLLAYRHWYSSGPFDVGMATSRALAGQGPSDQTQANGSLMRSSPLGLFAAGREALGADLARQDSRLTHPNPICQDSCAVFVAALAHVIAHGGGPEAAYRAALAEAERSSAQPAVRQVLDKAQQTPPDAYDGWSQGWVLLALHNAFWQLLHAPSLEEGVVATVMQGGDTDTNAAIAGALLGAVHGRDAVPPRWVSALLSCRPLPGTPTRHPRPVEFWPVDVLQLAEALLLAGRQDGET
jgi:ADP-ribosylglycohydrolase/fructose-1,6-bisphosphatase/inositol monophosphatase family enzyme